MFTSKKLLAAAAVFGGLSLAGAANAAQFDVQMLNTGPGGMPVFKPALVRVAPGDTVRFLNTNKGHNVESVKGMIPSGATPFRGKLNQPVTVTFTKSGVYGFRCMPHAALGMVGLVVVGRPDNEAAVKAVPQMGQAKAAFAKLFAQLDAKR